jgi:hypothetical protein
MDLYELTQLHKDSEEKLRVEFISLCRKYAHLKMPAPVFGLMMIGWTVNMVLEMAPSKKEANLLIKEAISYGKDMQKHKENTKSKA